MVMQLRFQKNDVLRGFIMFYPQLRGIYLYMIQSPSIVKKGISDGEFATDIMGIDHHMGLKKICSGASSASGMVLPHHLS